MAANDDKKLYKRRLKTDIDSFLFKFKRQYRQFPVREVTKLSKIRFKPDEKIKVSGYTYNIKEAIRKMKTTYRKLSRKIRPSYFAPTITAYDNDVKNKEKSTEIRSLYGVYKKQLDVEFKGMREDLWFCLYVLRELNRLSTQKTKVLTKELQAPVTESVLFSETDFEQNVDQFGKSKNLIFIAGLSGSGKSTKAAELAKRFHAAHIEMDLLEHNQILFDDRNPDEGNRILKEWFEQTFHGPKKLDAESKSFCSTVAKFISYIITYANTHKDQNFVVEGIQLMYMDDVTINKMKQFPVIIKGTSILKSMKNAADREGGVVDYAKSFHSLKEIQEYISFYKKDEGFRKTMKRKLTKQVATESAEKVSNQEIYDAVKDYIVTHKSKDIKMLNHPMTHQTKDGNWVLLATLSGNKYRNICEELSKNIKINNKQFNFHNAYLPGDVMLFVKEDELVIETKESEDISMDMFTESVEKDLSSLMDELIDEGAEISYDMIDNFGMEDQLLTETAIKSVNDIKYHQKEFESGQINLCFVVGYSGSGKSTLSSSISAQHTVIDMDKIVMGFDKPKEWFDKLPKVSQAFVYGPGRKYMMFLGAERPKNFLAYDRNISRELVNFIISWAGSHPRERFVADGVWTFLYIPPSQLDQFAVYVKGTSALTSGYRAGKRGSNQATGNESKMDKAKYMLKRIGANMATAVNGKFERYQKYFGAKVGAEYHDQKNNGSTMESGLCDTINKSEDISMDMFTESVNVESLTNIDKILFDAVEAGALSEEDYHVYTNFFTSPIKKHLEKLKNLNIKESVENAVAEKRLAIYEACQSGIITEDEREMLLNKLISAQVVAESVATATSDTSMSKEEQFDKARLDLYERCEAGMITIEEREDMIAEAHDTIFGNTDVVENADAAISAEDRMSGNSNSQTTTPTPGGTDTNQKMDNDVEKDMKKTVEDAQKQMNDIGK